MANVRIQQLPEDLTPVDTDVVAVDSTLGGTTRRVPIPNLGDLVRPLASQPEAEAGSNNTKTMTPLRTKQQIDARLADEATAIAGTNPTELLTPATGKASIDANAPDAAFLTDIANPNIFPMSARDRAVLGWNLLEFIPNNLHAAILDGTTTTAVTTRIQAAFDSGEILSAPRGLFLLDGTVDVTPQLKFKGAGRGKTIFRLPDTGLNGFVIRGNESDLEGFTVDLVNKDDTVQGACIVVTTPGSDPNARHENSRFCNIEVRNSNRQGFTSARTYNCAFTDLFAYNCGHRGFNMGAKSSDNVFTGIHARACGFSGFLLGFGASRNVCSNMTLQVGEISPGLVVHMGCRENLFSNVVIFDPQSTTEPHLHVGYASTDNIFTNFVLKDVNNRGIYISNGEVQEPEASAYGVVNGPNARNAFHNFRLLGDGTVGSYGIYIDEDATTYGIDGNSFTNFYVDEVTTVVRDVDQNATNHFFDNFRFGTGITQRWFMPAGTGHQVRNYPGVSNFGSLATTGPGSLSAHPTYSSTATVTNNYPFTVRVNVSGQSGTGAATLIGGVNPLVTSGNGQFDIPPGGTIQCTQGSTGTGQWRWFAQNAG